MAALRYASVCTALETILRAAPDLAGAHVTQDPDPPTDMQCGAVLIRLLSFDRRPRRIGPPSLHAAYDETLSIGIDCWGFSGQGPADARNQRDDLVQAVTDAVAADFTLGGAVLMAEVLGGEALEGQGNSIYQGMRLRLDAMART